MEFMQGKYDRHGSMRVRPAMPALPVHEPDPLLGRLLSDFTALAGQACQAPIALVSQLHGRFDLCAAPAMAAGQPALPPPPAHAAGDSRGQWWRFPGQSQVLRGDNDFSLCEASLPDGPANAADGVREIGDLHALAGWHDMPLARSMQGLRFYAAASFAHPQGEFLGTLCVLDRQPRNLAPAQRGALRTLARQLGDQLALHAEVRQLRYQALTDALTGVGNRRAFDQRLQEEWTRHLRSGMPMSLLMIDINLFKQYNDSFGHPAGDAVLAQLGRLLRMPLRDSDFVARYGGDEFAIILPDTDEAGAQQAAERVHAAIRGASWAHRPICLSIGLATLPPAQAADFGQLLQQADQAMYSCKRRC